ncbi:unconventional prefoldin RPB5 interactor 1-like [Apostichopus japonicus]|uniref:unconventional prefoldin RPB5 interactor 1-like n=1 Tax=Stichopus japonicus TaxID=307972 RepID=UPI003AB86907
MSLLPKMDQDLGRLKEEQLLELRNTGVQIRQWEKFKEDYNHLQEKLQELPDKVSYEVMVPLGPLAFMPGQLVHTNEILVLLGENWFVEKSAKDACAVIDRRKKSIADTINKFKEQKQLLESRLEFTADIQKEASGTEGIVDIREEYDPEKEAKWRENRAKRKRKTMGKVPDKEETDFSDGGRAEKTQSTREKEEAELWAHLDRLERQEEEMDELARTEESPDSDEPSRASLEEESPDETKKKTVKWKDQQMETMDEDKIEPKRNQGGDERKDQGLGTPDEEEGDEEEGKTSTIVFSHSDVPSALPSSPSDVVSSPADIYNRYQSKLKVTTTQTLEQPKSILKEPSGLPLSRDVEPETTQDKKPTVQPIPESAFSGNVVEHQSAAADIQPKKRVSKFKQARQVKGER